MINIIGGKFKRKKISVPGKDVRPTSSIKREAIFSILESYALKNSINLYSEKCIIDLFAGSGSLGLEAISRGAAFGYFYEIDDKVIKILQKNCYDICNNKEFQILQKDCSSIKNFNLKFSPSIVFIDPPYKYLFYETILKNLKESKIIDKNTIIIIECHKNNLLKTNLDYQIITVKTYGKTKLFFIKKL